MARPVLIVFLLLCCNIFAAYQYLDFVGVESSESLKCEVPPEIYVGDFQTGTHVWRGDGQYITPGSCIEFFQGAGPYGEGDPQELVVEEALNPLDFDGYTQQVMRRVGYVSDQLYKEIFNKSTEMPDNGPQVTERQVYGCAIQLLVWEINFETNHDSYSLTEGDFTAFASDDYYGDWSSDITDLIISEFDQLAAEAVNTPSDYFPQGTVYVPVKSGKDYQDFITVIVPEPATLALLGIGGILMRRRKISE
ncbi:PEP-CTERM sorting domain-containing protein [Sedimentisphaera salicampi]|uniref:Ice-binding protein C-terminal domain-containing protein n=1 Tax=Sedimentisphaera salicampi TaxID=1941349 RepID=A0A1W6LKL0_9BACT|nr:PEP-CTERM sorting domain-containing protein [Sedimentisphaera salicampi]ARN56264.1 hypothetical protein STSP1_00640 [Sedimentisphaera salicampi]OXU15546.1 hypothetical protein SMSP1_00628 [Sedimentisphaera salicampi]